MSEGNAGNSLVGLVWFLSFWGFIVVKAAGHIFAAWSWWWWLLPIVPWIGHIITQLGL